MLRVHDFTNVWQPQQHTVIFLEHGCNSSLQFLDRLRFPLQLIELQFLDRQLRSASSKHSSTQPHPTHSKTSSQVFTRTCHECTWCRHESHAYYRSNEFCYSPWLYDRRVPLVIAMLHLEMCRRHIHLYLYIYIYRERERKSHRRHGASLNLILEKPACHLYLSVSKRSVRLCIGWLGGWLAGWLHVLVHADYYTHTQFLYKYKT